MTRVSVHIRIPTEERAEWIDQARSDYQTLSEMVRGAVREYLRTRRQQRAFEHVDEDE